jgi:carbonic anhydrase/acetyltransferase-like protein (isoleucine patch superfamily)
MAGDPRLIALPVGSPQVAPGTFIAAGAVVAGDVTIDEDVNIWFGAVIRGDFHPIRIARGCCIQDQVMIHSQTVLGEYCTVGHQALLHGATVEAHALIGAGAIVAEGSHVGDHAVIAMGAVVVARQVAPYSVMGGNPARVIGTVTPEEAERYFQQNRAYAALAATYRGA